MHQISTLLLLLITAAAACTASKKQPAQHLLTPNRLERQVFEIDPAIAHTLYTKNGAVIRLPQNAFQLNGSGPVQLEVREAYSMNDILKAGLVTESNGKPLSSGGMIYLNARQNNREVALREKASVALPLSNYNSGMQVFKGELSGDSSINWVQPRPLDTLPAGFIEQGRALFASNCASCHGITTSGTGGPLYNILNRVPSKKWLYAFTRDWKTAFELHDSTGFNYGAYTCCISTITPTDMTAFPALTDSALDALYAYIQYESGKLPNEENEISGLVCAPCLEVPETWPIKKDTAAVSNNSVQNAFIPNEPQTTLLPAKESQLRAGFTDLVESARYVFSITTLGWYNIDMYYEGLPGTVNCLLEGTITGLTENTQPTIYLLVPSRKNLSVANRHDGSSWAFDKIDGKISLHTGDEALLLAFAETAGKVVYGMRYFKVQQHNTLQLTLKESTTAAFEQLVNGLRLNGLSMSIQPAQQTAITEPPAPAVTAADSITANTAAPVQGPGTVAKKKDRVCNCGEYQ